jgi:hypothetical protein
MQPGQSRAVFLWGGGGSNGVLRVTTRPLKAPFSLLNDFEWFLRRISGLLIDKTITRKIN